jgi:hypothetical protein
MLGVVVCVGFARNNLVVVSLTSSCVMTPLRLLSKTLHRMVLTWQRRRVRSRWGCNACSSRGRYRSCIVPGPAAAARRCCRRERPAACVGEGVLSDLVYFFTREHTSVLHRVRTLESVIHFELYRHIRDQSRKDHPPHRWQSPKA